MFQQETNVRTIIKGHAALLSKGNPFKTEVPALRFDFPSSGNEENFFEATVGDIAAGRGRVIKEKDNQDFEFEWPCAVMVIKKQI